MLSDTKLTADPAEIRRDLQFMTRRWHELPMPTRFELRAFKEGAQPQTATFKPDWIDDAVAWASNMVALGFNVYATRNPIRDDVVGSAKDGDIVAAFYLWADVDDSTAADNVRRFDGPKYTAVIRTGKAPTPRVHIYWELDEPCTDMAAWRDMQMRIAQHFKSDRAVINPSRIMRLAGTVTFPDRKKREKGYVNEQTALRTEFDTPRSPVSMEQMARVFAPVQNAPIQPLTGGVETQGGFSIDTGPLSLDRDRARIQALSGEAWHDAVIRLVASYVSKGLSDDEIHGLADPLTLDGYTVEETRREVQQAINGARAKGWTPEPAKTFEELTPEQEAEIPAFQFRPWSTIDLAQIPYPEFVYSDFYAKGYTSLTLAQPKVGKSMLGLAEALDMATGRGFLTGYRREPLRVVYYNAEDDQNVLNARVAALLTEYGIDQSEIAGRFWAHSGVDASDFFLVQGIEGVINEPLFVALEKFCVEQRADVLIFDPLQDLSSSPETNEVFRLLGQRLRRMASTCGVSLGIVHHTRKVAPGMQAGIDDARGGSALRGTARFNRVLNPMTKEEGENANVENHRFYFRIGDMESNLAPPSADVNRWFEKVSVLTPNGHHIGAVKPWQWPDAFDGVTVQQAAQVRNMIDHREEPPRLNVRAKDWVGEIVADVLGLNVTKKADKDRINRMVSKWIETDVLRVVEVEDKRAGRSSKAVIAGANNPLSMGGQE